MTASDGMDQSALERRLGYAFRDRSLLTRALTHRSYTGEHNERLEFLGDAALSCVISRRLFQDRNRFDEGAMTIARAGLVRESALAPLAARLGLGPLLRLSAGEADNGGRERPSILADALEAVLGAVFVDGGYDAVEEVVGRLFGDGLSASATVAESQDKSAKNELQELLQARHLAPPAYRLADTAGPPHKRVFTCLCEVPSLDLRAEGSGPSLRAAEQEAAGRVLSLLRRRDGS